MDVLLVMLVGAVLVQNRHKSLGVSYKHVLFLGSVFISENSSGCDWHYLGGAGGAGGKKETHRRVRRKIKSIIRHALQCRVLGI